MRIPILVDYDEATGLLFDQDGVMITSCFGLVIHACENVESPDKVLMSYNPDTGELYTKESLLVTVWMGLTMPLHECRK